MRNNISLIGMPGAGKSTTGIILAKNCRLGFIDTDVLIQINHQKTLQQILDESGYLTLRDVEKEAILKLNVDNHVIATGGSAVYSEAAMDHLVSISIVIFIEVSIEQVRKRERQLLYKRYAQITVDGNAVSQEMLAVTIASRLGW